MKVLLEVFVMVARGLKRLRFGVLLAVTGVLLVLAGPPAWGEEVPDEEPLSEDGGDLLGSDEDALLGGDDLLGDGASATFDWSAGAEEEDAEPDTITTHDRLMLEDRFPSASTCATCHPRHFQEWSVSQHAYAQLSPLMMTMQNAINMQVSTTLGDFCLRCHAPIASELNEPFARSNLDRHPAAREGITCITCHRISQPFGKVVGRMAVDQGGITDPIYGPTGNEELARVLDKPTEYRVVTDPNEPGRKIHKEARRYFRMVTPGFCGTCHEVLNPDGFRNEEALSEFSHSPAAKRGLTCISCHMGKEQGKDSGFDRGPAAVVGGVPTQERRLTSHYFAGPDSPIVHPGIFPHNVEAQNLKTMREWLEFDIDAGWGTDAFEDNLPDGYQFPESWKSIDDRYDARAIINKQLELLDWARDRRLEVMANAFELSEIEVRRASESRGLKFSLELASASDGHNMPTGFDAERLIWLDVTVRDADGKVVMRSGDRDPNGDLRDIHSSYVRAREVELDDQLFNLQSKTVVRLVRGGEREQVLPVNQSPSALPFARPSPRPTELYGRPPGNRKHRQGIEPNGSRTATYRVPAKDLTGRGPYTIEAALKFQAVPVNLVKEISVAGWDYGFSAREVADIIVGNTATIYTRTAVVDLHGQQVAEGGAPDEESRVSSAPGIRAEGPSSAASTEGVTP